MAVFYLFIPPFGGLNVSTSRIVSRALCGGLSTCKSRGVLSGLVDVSAIIPVSALPLAWGFYYGTFEN